MYKVLALKELRETAWISVVTLVLSALVIVGLTGFDFWSLRREPLAYAPFADARFLWVSGFLFPAFGIVLGLRQSLWESLRETSVFLLHRPMSRAGIFWTKLISGLAILWITTGLPLLIYCLWAATPGTHASPFYWSFTANCWALWFGTSAVYLASFLAGIRPTRWFGSRLLPLLPALVTIPIAATAEPLSGGVLVVLVVLVVDAVFLAAIFHTAATRDYP